MNFTHFLITVLAGIIGTIAMTAFMYMFSAITNKDTKVLQILGSMVTGTTREYSKEAIVAGTLGHFSVGVLFSFAYFLLWNWGVFQINLTDSIILGAISGIVAMAVWKGYFWLHQHPPRVHLGYYLIALFIAHIIFGMVTVFAFDMMISEPEFYHLQK